MGSSGGGAWRGACVTCWAPEAPAGGVSIFLGSGDLGFGLRLGLGFRFGFRLGLGRRFGRLLDHRLGFGLGLDHRLGFRLRLGLDHRLGLGRRLLDRRGRLGRGLGLRQLRQGRLDDADHHRLGLQQFGALRLGQKHRAYDCGMQGKNGKSGARAQGKRRMR